MSVNANGEVYSGGPNVIQVHRAKQSGKFAFYQVISHSAPLPNSNTLIGITSVATGKPVHNVEKFILATPASVPLWQQSMQMQMGRQPETAKVIRSVLVVREVLPNVVNDNLTVGLYQATCTY